MNLIHTHAHYFTKIKCLVLPFYLHLDLPSFHFAVGFTTNVSYGLLNYLIVICARVLQNKFRVFILKMSDRPVKYSEE